MDATNPIMAGTAAPDEDTNAPTVQYQPPANDTEEPTVQYQQQPGEGADEYARAAPVTGKPAVAQALYQTFKGRGWTDAAIHGALANGLDESNLNSHDTGPANELGIFQFNPHADDYWEYKRHLEAQGLNSSPNGPDWHDPVQQANYIADWTDKHMPGYAQSTDPYRATDQFMTGFERPADMTLGRRFPKVHEAQMLTFELTGGGGEQQYAQAGVTPPSTGAPIPELNRAQMRAAAIQEAGIRSDPRMEPAPSTTSTAPPPGTTAYYQQRAQLLNQQGPLEPYGMPPEGPTVMQQVKHMASYLPPAFASGFADFLDMPVHLINGAIRFAAAHPALGLQMTPESGMVDAITGDHAVSQIMGNPTGPPQGQIFSGNGHNLVSGLPSQANTPSQFEPPQLPGEGAAQAALPGAMKAIGIDSRSPREKGDESFGTQAAWDIGSSLGQAGPFQFIGAGRALATTGVRAALTKLGTDALITGAFPGLGEVLGNELVGPGAEPVGQIIGGVIGAKMATLRSGVEALVFDPAWQAGKANAPGLISKALDSAGPKVIANAAADDFAGALARVQALREAPGASSTALGLTGEAGQPLATGGAAGNLVPGFTTPAYTLSGDPGLRTLGNYLYRNDPSAFRNIRDVVDNNMNAVKNALGVDTAQIDQAKDAISDYSKLRDLNTQTMLANAQERARLDTEAATAGAIPGGSVSEKANRSAATMEQLLRVDQDRRTLANADFAAARDSGAMNATVGPPNTTYNAAYNLLSEYRRLHLEGSIPQEATDLLFGAGSKPEALFDRAGNRLPPDPAFAVEHQYGPSTTLEQQQALVSQLGNIQSNEGALIRTGSPGADPQKVRFLGQLNDAARQDFEAGLNASGNPAIVRNALNNWDEYRSTFRQGIIGRVLGFDASGAPRVSPEAAIDTVLRNGTQGVANTRALLATLGTPDPVTGVMRNPASALRDQMLGFLRQDFANATNQGQRTMEAWAQNHEEVLMGLPGPAGQPFRQLSNEVNQAISSGQAALGAAAKPSESAGDAVTLFLKGNPGGELDKALAGANRGKSMSQLLDATQSDPSGNATRGLAGMVMDRMFSAGAKENQAGGWDLNPGLAQTWFNTNKDAISAMDRALPGFTDRAEQVANSLQRVAEIQANPGKPLTEKDLMNAASLNGIGRLGFRMIGASMGEKIGHLLPGGMGGRLQHAAIGAEAGMQLYDATFAKLSRGTAAATIREAMMDPERFAQLSKPWRTVQDAQQASGAVGQLLDRLPRGYLVSAAVNLTTPTKVDPQQPKATGPNLQQLGMPPQSTALPTAGIGQTTAPGQLPGQPAGPTMVPGGRAFPQPGQPLPPQQVPAMRQFMPQGAQP